MRDIRLLVADITTFTAISETQVSHSVLYLSILASVDDCGAEIVGSRQAEKSQSSPRRRDEERPGIYCEK